MLEIFNANADFVVRILVAAGLGAAIGLERDKHGRAAGLRTHLLVSLGAAVFTILSHQISQGTAGTGFVADPGRIAAQIIAGIGFLGAGVILKSAGSVRGLTTAACLWTAAAVGMAAGAGLFFIAGLTTAVALAGLIFLKFTERLYAKDSFRTLVVVTSDDVGATQIIEIVRRKHLSVLGCEIMKDFLSGTTETKLAIQVYHKGLTDNLAHGIIESLENSGITLHEVRWLRSS